MEHFDTNTIMNAIIGPAYEHTFGALDLGGILHVTRDTLRV